MENEHEMFGEDLTGDDELEDIEIGFTPKPSFAVDAKYIELREEAKTDVEETLEDKILEDELLVAETEPAEFEDEKLPSIKPPDHAEIPEADFFSQPAIVDEKQKVVESIEGMTEVADADATFDDDDQISEAEAKEAESHPRLSSVRDSSVLSSGKTSMRITGSMESEDSRMAKPSLVRKFTIQYPEKARITGWESEVDDLMMGFEELKETELMLDEIVEEEEHVEEEVEEKEPTLARAPYYEKHDKFLAEIAERKIRSFILQKKLAMYFKRKKVDQATKEFDWSLTQQIKYNRKLETWYEFMIFDERERENMKREIQISKQEREEQFNKLQNMFKQMQNREREIGYGLIYKKSGNVVPDKVVDRMINRQGNQMKEVCSMRFSYIKLKQILHEKLTIMSSLNEVSPGFLLANYEQLKVMNQSFADKIEERDEELTRLRSKCANTIQILAHIREKSTALDSDVTDLHDELAETEIRFSRVRVELNGLKQKRDICRHNIIKIRNESGLLTKPTLLRDMQEELDNAEQLAQHLQTCKQTNKNLSKRVKTIRMKIEEAKDIRKISSRRLIKKDSSLPRASTDAKPMLYKGRPSLMMPFIDPRAFDCLKSIKPQFTYDRRLHNIKCSKTK